MKKYILNKVDALKPFVLVAFPGGFRFIAVFLCTLLLSNDISDQFSSAFLISSFIVSFIGLPVAATLADRHFQLSDFQKYYFVIILTGLSLLLYYTFRNEQNWFFYIDIFLAVIVLSFFEIQRAGIVNSGNYSNVYITSIISVFLLLAFSYAFYIYNFTSCALVFFALFLPSALNLRLNKLDVRNQSLMKFGYFILLYRDYSLSSFFSTSTNTAIPLLVANYSNKSLVSDFAQVFAASSLAMLVPRALSAKMMPIFRKDGPSSVLIAKFKNKIIVYIALISTVSFVAMYFIYDNYILLWLYFFSVQCSQINLPYSNALSVESKSSELLKINMAGFGFVCICSILLYSFSLLNVMVFMSIFLISQFVKFYFSGMKCKTLYGV